MKIRTIQESDAEKFLELKQTLDNETHFMAYELGERCTSIEEQRSSIASVMASHARTILVAEEGGNLIGFLAAVGEGLRRARRRVSIIVGIRQSHVRQGIGQKLFEEIERWASANAIRRLELTVMTHNAGALALYRKVGFTIEGTRKDSLFVDEQFVDEYAMTKLI
jgi:RimJ/RimL family protein N-acetyltransferase